MAVVRFLKLEVAYSINAAMDGAIISKFGVNIMKLFNES